MKLSLCFGVFLTLSAWAATLSDFNGVWVLARGQWGGNEAPDNLIGTIVTIKDGSYERDDHRTVTKGTLKLDVTKSPVWMDVIPGSGDNEGKVFPAIAEITADGWRACYSFGGGDRPTQFKTSDGDGYFFAEYKRKPGTEPATPRPLRVLLLAGGCCHDYEKQKDILKQGLEARANVQVDFVFSPDGSTHPPLPIYGKPDYADGYDVVLHDECAADISDPQVIEGVLKPHRDGIPGVNLHCAMHCYRIGDPNTPALPHSDRSRWFDYLGLQSSGHGAQKPIAINFLQGVSPVTQGLANWTTINEELYNNILIWGDARPIARGSQDAGDVAGRNDSVVAWTHEYGPKKTRVFSTTIGHNNETVQDPRYLDLVTHGLLWACGKLNADGTPVTGYGPRK
jgi:uncharacterized protein (TIGR03067 family)